MEKWKSVIRACVAEPVAGLFPPQRRDWALPESAGLSPRAQRRVVREAVTQPYGKAAEAINEDWGTSYHGKQIQRVAQQAGEHLLEQQRQEREAYQQGQRPRGPENDPALLVIGMDGGRVQGREKRESASGGEGSRWREDKVLTISSYLPGVPEQQKDPQPLVTTYLATMHASDDFGTLARLEAERRGIRQAKEVVVLGDGAAWIDTLHQKHFPRHVRIVDWYHAKERLYAVARAAEPDDQMKQSQLAQRLTTALWDGQALSVAEAIARLSRQAGPPRGADPQEHPRRVLQRSAGYFQRHAKHMNYPAYRKRGWPIGTGMTEAGVKQFNKRVKGTEQFWNDQGVEPILALRSLRLSDDGRWDHYWLCRSTLRQAA
ncbi:MAG: hypothetical protein ACLFV7_14120 [Phycisphaerae bacterium]